MSLGSLALASRALLCSSLLETSPYQVGITGLYIQYHELSDPASVDDNRDSACTAREVGSTRAPASGGVNCVTAAGRGTNDGSCAGDDVQDSGDGSRRRA